VRHGVLNPGVAFLHKPFTSDTLGRKISEVLDPRQSKASGLSDIPAGAPGASHSRTRGSS
jgi:hypothetical protein